MGCKLKTWNRTQHLLVQVSSTYKMIIKAILQKLFCTRSIPITAFEALPVTSGLREPYEDKTVDLHFRPIQMYAPSCDSGSGHSNSAMSPWHCTRTAKTRSAGTKLRLLNGSFSSTITKHYTTKSLTERTRTGTNFIASFHRYPSSRVCRLAHTRTSRITDSTNLRPRASFPNTFD